MSTTPLVIKLCGLQTAVELLILDDEDVFGHQRGARTKTGPRHTSNPTQTSKRQNWGVVALPLPTANISAIVGSFDTFRMSCGTEADTVSKSVAMPRRRVAMAHLCCPSVGQDALAA